jgi:multiple sugar transport system permease protein
MIQIILGLFIAVLMESILVGTGLMRALIILPMAVTPAVSGLIWRILYDPTLGLLNYLLSLIGIKGLAWVANSSTALASIILVDIWQWTPFSVLLIAAGLKALPIEPYESARIDGANSIQLFFYVTLPLLKNTLYVLILFRSIDIIKVFDIIYVITGGGPGVATQTATYYAFVQGFGWFNLSYASTIALAILVIVICLTEIFIRRTGVLREN